MNFDSVVANAKSTVDWRLADQHEEQRQYVAGALDELAERLAEELPDVGAARRNLEDALLDVDSLRDRVSELADAARSVASELEDAYSAVQYALDELN